MKIITNIRFAQTAGIAQVVLSFMDFLEKGKNKNLKITAVNIVDSSKHKVIKRKGKNTSTISYDVKVPSIADSVNGSKNIKQVEKIYSEIIEKYREAIKSEKPDVALINGTYFMPWCMFIAAKAEKIPVVLHYHGVLTKEVEHWPAIPRKIFLDMERSFDSKDVFYIFPSKITKNVVEKEVFKHKIKKSAVIANPVPEYFFGTKKKTTNNNIGIITRWTRIKNIKFCEDLANYNSNNGNKYIINAITDLDTKGPIYKNLSKIIKFHKPTNNRGLISFYKKMGVVISPSYFETYGNVAKESIASGTPAMVNNNMGVSETFNRLGLKDWIINFDSVESVYNKIEETMGKIVKHSIRKKIKDNYNHKIIFDQIISILTNK